MNTQTRMSLSRIAHALLGRGGERGRMFYIEAEDLEDFDIPDAIISLAYLVRDNKSLPLAAVLPTFFTEAAVELLLKTPNHFYFLSLVAYSCDSADTGDRIGKEAVQQAAAQMRGWAAGKFNLEKRLADLADDPGGQAKREIMIASRLAGGLILFKNGSFEQGELIDNPIFFDPAFVSSTQVG